VPARVSGAAVLAVAALLAACGGEDDGRDAPGRRDLPQGTEPVDLEPRSFSADVDHRYWPMKPGRRWTYREVDEEGKELRVVVTVTSETKRIANGVTARVVRDTVTEDGELIEDTFDWYAQDEEGNVWYLGEDTAEFGRGRLTTKSGSFEAGVDGALPGVIMPARPLDDMQYRQEHYEGKAEDRGEILAANEQVEVPAGHYTNALLTKDTNPLEPRVLEYKLYAPNVGPVLAIGVSGGGGREELVEVEQVSARAAKAAGTARLGERYP
jgi:hypothetical protein